MKKKLRLLNVVLAALLVWGCLALQGQYERARQRHEIFEDLSAAAKSPALPVPAEGPATRAATYAAISQRLLLSRDRNPVIEVIVAEESEAERPQTPLLAGVVDLGDGPLALMTPDADTPPRWTGIGEKIGEYTLQAVADDTVTLEWNGENIELSQAELAEVKLQRRSRGTTSANSSAGSTTIFGRGQDATANLSVSSNVTETGKYTIGKQLNTGTFAANPNDGAKDGVEYKGYVRRVRVTPFGSQHWWQKKEQ